MTPLTHPNEYSVMVFGASVSPGTVTFTGHDREWTWDVETAKGQKGASSKLAGDTIGQPQATFYLASVEDQIAWPAFQRVLEASLVPTPTAQPVYHPDLAANRYTELAVANIGGILRDSNGGATVVVKFIEYRPPKPAPSKSATGGGGGDRNDTRTDPNAARKEQLEELLEEARNA